MHTIVQDGLHAYVYAAYACACCAWIIDSMHNECATSYNIIYFDTIFFIFFITIEQDSVTIWNANRNTSSTSNKNTQP